MKRLLIAGIFSFLFFSCADEVKNTDEEKSVELHFSSKTIEEKLDDCLPENGECTFISLTFPVAEDGQGAAEKINESIERFLLNTIDYQDDGTAQEPEELAKSFIENYQETAEDFPEYELAWEATISGEIAYRSSEIISVKFKTDMFTGGAHGYRSTNYLIFDPETGEKIKSEDLFTSEFRDFVELDFRKKQGIPENANINSTGLFFENDVFQLPANIGITGEQVILHYNAYEVAPYSAGNFVLRYSRDSIQDYLRIKPVPKPDF